MIITWILTVVLVGTTIEFEDTFPSEELCRKEGIRQVQDYQAGNIRAMYECEPHETPCEADYCI